jgi:plastocyanin
MDKTSSKNKIATMASFIAAIVTVVVVAATIASSIFFFSYKAQAQMTPTTNTNVTHVRVGGGNATYPFFGYNPQKVEIKAGDTIVWTSPSTAPPAATDPHTVTFVLNNKTMTDTDVPFGVPSSTKFMPLPPDSKNQPTMLPTKNGMMNTILASNGRVFNPAIIDSTGNVRVSGPNASFTMAGNEQYVNSGWLLPKGNPIPGTSDTFSVTFQKTGTYNYLCILHPWMAGTVVVK